MLSNYSDILMQEARQSIINGLSVFGLTQELSPCDIKIRDWAKEGLKSADFRNTVKKLNDADISSATRILHELGSCIGAHVFIKYRNEKGDFEKDKFLGDYLAFIENDDETILNKWAYLPKSTNDFTGILNAEKERIQSELFNFQRVAFESLEEAKEAFNRDDIHDALNKKIQVKLHRIKSTRWENKSDTSFHRVRPHDSKSGNLRS